MKLTNKVINSLLKYNTIFIFISLVIVSSLASNVFFTERNIFNLLRQVTGIGIISMGMLLVILTGGIDLSVGSVLALASVLSAHFLLSMSLPAAIVLTILIGVLLGCVSGYLVSIRRMAPFVVTLALMTIARGFAFIASKGSPILLKESGAALKSFGSNYWLKIPQPVILMFVVFIIIFLILKYTVFGRLLVAIGSNETSVRLSGIQVWIYKFLAYSISGAFAAIAGIISTARTGVGSAVVGVGFELDAIAAVVIGGASLSGGRGTAVNTLLGVFILGMIGNIMNLKNVPAYPQQVIKGLIIIFAVLLQGIQRRLDKE
ncbi:MAG TPA: ABC transporter permease [Phycisphaerales bacterium]|nr:ABC transporter permease [Phycisphaerales bacterium]